MPAQSKGSIFKTRAGYGIRWSEDGKRPQKTGFKSKTEARNWFNDQVAGRLRHGGPSPDLTFDAFCGLYLARWEPTVAPRTRITLRDWLRPAREHFGSWSLVELEHATDDIATWHADQPSESTRHARTRALRQVLAAAKRWGYIHANPALDFGHNHEPRRADVRPFTRAQIERLAVELGPVNGAIVIFAAETGLRTHEWVALERRDLDRTKTAPAVSVTRRVTRGQLTPYPKTERRRVPLTARALGALEQLPPSIPLVFPAAQGGYIDLDNWRLRDWYPALEAAGIDKRGPYQLRHTFATEALASGMSIFELSRVMGASVKTIDRHYGHLAHDAEDHIRDLLNKRSGVFLPSGPGGQS